MTCFCLKFTPLPAFQTALSFAMAHWLKSEDSGTEDCRLWTGDWRLEDRHINQPLPPLKPQQQQKALAENWTKTTKNKNNTRKLRKQQSKVRFVAPKISHMQTNCKRHTHMQMPASVRNHQLTLALDTSHPSGNNIVTTNRRTGEQAAKEAGSTAEWRMKFAQWRLVNNFAWKYPN